MVMVGGVCMQLHTGVTPELGQVRFRTLGCYNLTLDRKKKTDGYF